MPPPKLIAPEYGEYKSPITFSWSGTPNVFYQVTLRHRVEGHVHVSDWIQGFEWTFDIPGEQFGDWEWFVTARNGASSDVGAFVFDPFLDRHISRYDFNLDCYINQADLDLITAALNSENPDDLARFDLNGDGRIDDSDIAEVQNRMSDVPYCTPD